MSTSPTESTSAPPSVDSLEAYERVRAEIEAVPASEVSVVNIDILIGVTTVLGSLPKLRQLRPQLAAIPGFDIPRFDRLEPIARALGHTHTLLLRSSARPPIAELVEQAVKLREVLLMDATALATRGLLDSAALRGLKGAVGYRNLAFDLGALSNLLLQVWSQVRGKCAVQESELSLARTLADRLLTAVGRRQFESPAQSAATLTRARAFTVFVKSYDQIRRAVTYLRWDEDDANEFAPSLYERRNKKKANEAAAPAPASNPVAAQADEAPATPVAAGLPGDEPFES
jgi:hypothetical protein